MNTESNRRVNLRTQSMAWSDFQLLSHPSPLPLFSQSDKHHKKPMFLHLLHRIRFKHHLIYTSFISKIHDLLYVRPVWVIF